MIATLGWIASHSRACLLLGLAAGLTLQPLAETLRHWIPHMIAALLLVTSARIGPRAALGATGALPRTVLGVFALQLACPLLVLLLLAGLGLLGTPLALVVILTLAAPSITGAANFTIILGHDPAPALRLMVVGTALFPLTVLPVLFLVPGLGGPAEVLQASVGLMVVIAGACGLGFALRGAVWTNPDAAQIRALDGVSSILLAVVVVGLMSAVGPAIAEMPATFAYWALVAFALNFGSQALAFLVLRRRVPDSAVPVSIVAGNRNVALFLVALPAATVDPLLVFIGCYQLPMYLTPILLARFYPRGASHA